MATKENRKVLPRYNRSAPRPGISRGTSGKAALTRFGTKLFPFPVNLGPTGTYDSAMGGNASTGLESADHRSLRDMKSMGADDRPTDRDDDTNRKSLFPATKTLLNINIMFYSAQYYFSPDFPVLYFHALVANYNMISFTL